MPHSYLCLGGVLNVCHNFPDRVLRLGGVVRLAVKGDNILPVLDNLLRDKGDIDGEAVAGGSLPSGLSAPAAADLVEAAGGVGALIAAEGEDERSNVVGLEGLDHLLWHDGGGHGCAGVGGDCVDKDVVLVAFEGEGAREAENTAFLNS